MHTIKSCPTCGSRRIRRVRRDVSGTWMGQPFIAKSIEFHYCPICDEKVYDREALRRMQSFYPARKALTRRKAS